MPARITNVTAKTSVVFLHSKMYRLPLKIYFETLPRVKRFISLTIPTCSRFSCSLASVGAMVRVNYLRLNSE